jgi:hypothetical protein
MRSDTGLSFPSRTPGPCQSSLHTDFTGSQNDAAIRAQCRTHHKRLGRATGQGPTDVFSFLYEC